VRPLLDDDPGSGVVSDHALVDSTVSVDPGYAGPPAATWLRRGMRGKIVVPRGDRVPG
jgi:hypothetical protein